MPFAKKLFQYAAMTVLRHNGASGETLFDAVQQVAQTVPRSFDPELLYVECQRCNAPVMWDKGKTSTLLEAAGIDCSLLDEHCLILSEGCPLCTPMMKEGFVLSVVRVANLTPEEAVHMMRPGGNA